MMATPSAPPVRGGFLALTLLTAIALLAFVAATASAAPGDPTARGDTYATPTGKVLSIRPTRISGVLYNDFDTDETTGEPIGNGDLTAVLVTSPSHGALYEINGDGSKGAALAPGGTFNGGFVYEHDGSQGDNDNDSFTYKAVDADAPPNESEETIVNIHIESDQSSDLKITMNYELGMHCTGFEFSYCCILPPYNSIVAQVTRSQTGDLALPQSNADYPRLLEGDPNEGLDALGRETVLRDYEADGTIKKYFLKYFHDAQPRLEGNMPGSFNTTAGKTTLISAVEGNSLLYQNTPYDSAKVDETGEITGVPGKLVTGTYGPGHDVILGDGDYTDNTDNFANGWLNHFYIYADLEGTIPGECTEPAESAGMSCTQDADCDTTVGPSGHGNGVCNTDIRTSRERNKIRLGVSGHVEYPADVGAALQPMGPTGSDSPVIGGNPIPAFDNVLTFSGDTGTVVYTQMKVLENLPIMLTAPKIWEALGLPLTPFPDDIGFFHEPGAVDEDTIRPFVAMKAQLHEYPSGAAVMNGDGKPVIGFGSAPIDIPNCERCHSAPAAVCADAAESYPCTVSGVVEVNANSPAYVRRQDGPKPFYGPAGQTLQAMVDMEIAYWKFVYPSLTTGTDWYARLKGAAISINTMHDFDNGTDFTAQYPASTDLLGLPPEKAALPQNTRMGHEAVICQKCHADNVIAVVKSASKGSSGGPPLLPMSEAIHRTHRVKSAGGPIVFNDSFGRFGGCQGCHPSHRSDGVMDNYPLTYGGDNGFADSDNRLGGGGCFVGRDVHSNILKDVDADTPSHLTAVGEWLVENVALGGGEHEWRGIWCTNCHTQLSQEIWRTEDCNDLINGDCITNPRGEPTLAAVASAVGVSPNQAMEWLDPKSDPDDPTKPYPGYSADFSQAIWNGNVDYPDAGVATVEVGPGGAVGTHDPDDPDGSGPKLGDLSVNILSFCTTPDCVNRINNNKGDESQWRYPEGGAVDGVAGFIDTANIAVPVAFSVADDARDHWLAPGEPHCADCHAAPFTEQSGNINPYPPFNYPAKASLFRYSRGHQELSCQACHESTHGLYPVGPAIDNTTYAQAASLNHDGSHGPLKCGTCHKVNEAGIPYWVTWYAGGAVGGQISSFDDAVAWAHTYTAEANVLNSTCQNCHGVNGDFSSAPDTNSTPAQWTNVASHEEAFLRHADNGFASRQMMDKAEILVSGHVTGEGTKGNEVSKLCSSSCHKGPKFENMAKCGNPTWMQHLPRGRVAESVWEQVSKEQNGGSTCGW
jgi:hypothetical protein